MSAFTKGEALAFVEAIRLNLDGKTGFKWFVERLSFLADYIESTAAENQRLNAYLDSADARDDYESYCAGNPNDAASPPVQPANR
jgi:hypothetical protein